MIVEGYVEKIIFHNEENGYSVFTIEVDKDGGDEMFKSAAETRKYDIENSKDLRKSCMNILFLTTGTFNSINENRNNKNNRLLIYMNSFYTIIVYA